MRNQNNDICMDWLHILVGHSGSDFAAGTYIFFSIFAIRSADHRIRQCIELCVRTDSQNYGNYMGTFVLMYRLCSCRISRETELSKHFIKVSCIFQ